MRLGAIELGFKEIVIAILAVVILIIIILLFVLIINPAVEAGSVFGRRSVIK